MLIQRSQASSAPCVILQRGGLCTLMRPKPCSSRRGGHNMSPAVAGSYSPRCGATADRMELNPVWALGVKAMTVRIFYGRLSDITAVQHKVCPQKGCCLASTIKAVWEQQELGASCRTSSVIENTYCLFVCAGRFSGICEKWYDSLSCGEILGWKDIFDITHTFWVCWLTDNGTTHNPFVKPHLLIFTLWVLFVLNN